MINTKLQSIIDTKSAIGNAIVNKGGTITSETPFFNYAAQIDGISTGTPQTIFQASDGSKWALSNVVNLTNVSNNVTYDFNRWQPANNGTSDPILNIGTVGANISGNIAIVQVNQVNISQYENIVINDTTGAKYVGYNGYDSQTNPTPTGNTTFNRWLLNNSASGTVLFANTTVTNGGTFNGTNEAVNIASMPFINNTPSYGAAIEALALNNGFIYAGGGSLSGVNRGVSKFRQDNLALVGNTVNYGGDIWDMVINNGFIFAGGPVNNSLQKFGEDNLTRVGTSVNYGGFITSLALNNGFVYVGGWSNQRIHKFGEGNLSRVGTTNSYGSDIFTVTTNNGFIYVGGQGETVQKFYESNLAFVGNTVSYAGRVFNVATNNGFLYVGGETNQRIKRFYESNLAFVDNSATYGGRISKIKINNGFIYIGGETNTRIQKFYESNLAFIGSSVNLAGTIEELDFNGGFIYAGGQANQTVLKFGNEAAGFEQFTFYTATKIKE